MSNLKTRAGLDEVAQRPDRVDTEQPDVLDARLLHPVQRVRDTGMPDLEGQHVVRRVRRDVPLPAPPMGISSVQAV